MDQTLTSRLGIRMLCEHHLAQADLNDRPNYFGIINVTMKLKDVVDNWCEYVTKMSEHHYGRAPQIKVNGHINVQFPYIQTPLDYILPELLKNASRYVYSDLNLNGTDCHTNSRTIIVSILITIN